MARYLAHPGAETARLAHRLAHALAHLWTTAGPVVVALGLALAVALRLARRAEARRMAEGARLVRVLAPPEVDPEGAATLWSNLVALLRPAWRRALGGQPHVCFELTASAGVLDIAFWVPGPVPPGLVERAVEAAWPGARAETVPAAPPLGSSATVATGGEMRLALPEHYPLRTDHKVDPLRPLLGALAGLGEAEPACVQVLARPLTGRRLARLHKAAAARRSGRPVGGFARLVDLAGPGPNAQPVATDPARGADVAAILAKAAQPCWAICVRYAVATSATDGQATARLRGHAHAVASAFALFAGRNRFERRRLPHPAAALAGRRLGRGDLVSVGELAALAHLPTDVTVAGLARAGAKAVPPPPAVSRATLAAARAAAAFAPGAPGGTGPRSCLATPRPAAAAPSPWPSPTPATTST